jgi:iron complex transport system substrate-binding protein
MRAPALLAGGAALLLAGAVLAGPRVLSLDQCADQYVVALSPRPDIVGLSMRATHSDSYLAAQAQGLPQKRATLESALGARPDVVVRYWGGDARLVSDLRRRGVTVVEIDDAADFPGVRTNIRRVAGSLGQGQAGERLISAMDARLAAAAGAGRGHGALYVTSGGDTMGAGTLIDAMIRAAGFSNLAPHPGFGVVSLEALVLNPPAAIILGFFDIELNAAQRWSVGRQRALMEVAAPRTLVSLPGGVLGCPAWFAADGATSLAHAVGQGA